jgi:hypothetical protein
MDWRKTMTKKLSDQLIGAWKLVSYVENPVDGSPTVHPLGRDASGITLYTPDGWVSAQLMGGGRRHFAFGDWFRGTAEEYRQEASTYIAYSGSFSVDEEKKTVTHSMFMSLFPNWTELTQTRDIKLEGDTLHLSTQVPILSGGKRVISYLEWRRAERQ